MQRLLRQWLALTAVMALFLVPQAALGEERDLESRPWEKFGAKVGVFLSATDSSFRIGSGVGLDIDVEELLGLDTSTSVFRADALWRFTQNRRHRLDFTWFSLNRDGRRQILDDIVIEGDDGDKITIPSGTALESFFNLDIYEIAYSYSFIQDERLDLAVGVGLYVMPIDFGIRVSGLLEEEGSETFTAPLPVLGLRMDVAITPQWFIRSGAQVFYLEYDNFVGSVAEFRAALEYDPWKHVGIGLGFDMLGVRIEADGEDWPGVDLKGDVKFNYAGLQLYLKVFF